MNWKEVFKLTKEKIISFVVLTAITQYYAIWQVLHPLCIGPCGSHVETLSWRLGFWGEYTLLFTLVIVVCILVVSLCYSIVKKRLMLF
jgi:hypothetical protein